MSLADEFREIANECRAIPAEFGLYEHSVSIIQSRWSSGIFGEGIEEKTETPITVYGGANPKVHFPSQREIALGLMSLGEATIGPFTPDYGTGGISRSMLDGDELLNNDGFLVKIVGPQCSTGALYRIKNKNVDHALRITLVCIPSGSA